MRVRFAYLQKKTIPAGFTVEASYVMAIVLFSLACLIGTAYRQSRQETGIMLLHFGVERLRGQEGKETMEVVSGNAKGTVLRKEKCAAGKMQGNGWTMEIEAGLHDPEEYMRKLTIFEAEARVNGDMDRNAGGDQLSP